MTVGGKAGELQSEELSRNWWRVGRGPTALCVSVSDPYTEAIRLLPREVPFLLHFQFLQPMSKLRPLDSGKNEVR